MKTALAFPLAAALALVPLAASLAQSPVPAEPAASASAAAGSPAQPGRGNQKIQRIHIEDAGARIDELRVGGETEKITVQPKANVPPYEVKPAEGARGTPPAASGGDTNGSRVWNLLKF